MHMRGPPKRIVNRVYSAYVIVRTYEQALQLIHNRWQALGVSSETLRAPVDRTTPTPRFPTRTSTSFCGGRTAKNMQHVPTVMPSPVTMNLLGAFVIIAAVLLLLLRLHQEYLLFVELGPGGTPTTFSGFLKVQLLGLFALPNPYLPPPTPRRLQNTSGYLSNLKSRKGPRPTTRGIAPHRQINEKSDPAIYDKLALAINEMASESEDLVVGTSCFEKNASTGLFSTRPVKCTCDGEICHSHPSDGSLHLTLHPADTKTVLEAGWGERHPIARGGWFERFVPAGFMMIYAPRDEEEIEVVLRVVRAATWFVSGGDGVVMEADNRRRNSGCGSADESVLK